MMNLDFINTLFLAALVIGVGVAYWIRISRKGRASYERVEKHGSSPLLGKDIMVATYWFLQPIAKLLIFFHITPNKLSWGSLFFGILSGASLAFGHFGSGAVFATISALLDSLDGIVARFTGLCSDAGEVLDAAVDRYVEFIFLAGLVIYYRPIPILQILALFALLGSFMVSYSSAKAETFNISPPKGSMRRPERAMYLIIGAALSPLTISWFETYREFGIAIGHPMVMALCLVGLVSNVSAIERLCFIAKEIRNREKKAKEEAKNSLAKSEVLDEEASGSSVEHRV